MVLQITPSFQVEIESICLDLCFNSLSRIWPLFPASLPLLTPCSMAFSFPLPIRLEMFFRASGSSRISWALACLSTQLGKPSATDWRSIRSLPETTLHWGKTEWDQHQGRDKLPTLQTYLFELQLFIDQNALLALWPLGLGSQVLEKAFEIGGREWGQLLKRQQGDTAAKLT